MIRRPSLFSAHRRRRSMPGEERLKIHPMRGKPPPGAGSRYISSRLEEIFPKIFRAPLAADHDLPCTPVTAVRGDLHDSATDRLQTEWDSPPAQSSMIRSHYSMPGA
jgi:hypothetical protein